MLSRNVISIREAHKAASSVIAKPVEKVTKLGSGLTVATVEKNGPVTQLVLAFRAGSRYENANQAGLSHTIRNFVGRDTREYPGTSVVWSSSAAGGVLRAFTTRDLFGVALTVPRDQTSTGLSILGQAAALPGFKPWEVEDVLPTMRADNGFRTEYDYVVDGIHKAAYRNGGLGNSIFAPCSKIGSICANTLSSFADKYFVSGNGVLFATNASHQDLALYGENFSPIRSGAAVSTPSSAYKGGEFRNDADTKYAHVIVAGEGAAGNNAKALATQAVLLTALGNSSPVKFSTTTSGILGKAVGSSASASAFQAVHSDSGLAGVYILSDAAHIQSSVNATVGALKSFKADKIDAVKRQAYNNALRASAHSENFALERTAQLFVSQDNYIDQIPNVTASDVEAAAKKLTSKLSVASYGNINAVPYVDSL